MQIRAENLVKTYKGRKVVNGVSLHVNSGEIVGLLGPNGAGKTTTFYIMVGLLKPNNGHVFKDDIDITSKALHERARMGIGYLPQEASVFRDLTVEQNIEAILELRSLSKADQTEIKEQLLNEFSITHIRKNKGRVLSGGERRRTEMARALAMNPRFILLDEPFAGVDPIAVEEMQELVTKLKSKNIGVLITDHSVNATLSISDRAYLMFEGTVLKSGASEELAQDEKVRKVYLGENFVFKNKSQPYNNNPKKTESLEDLN